MPKIDFENYKGGREQAYVKHALLENYLAQLAYKVGDSWNPIVYIDGFAGPWDSKDEQFADASFGIATRVLKEAVRGLLEKRGKLVNGLCVFVEKRPDAFVKLKAFADASSTESVRAIALQGRFIDNLAEIERLINEAGRNPFKFLFLDQKGWAGAPLAKLRPFVAERSCELLFNLMTSFLTRFVDTETRSESYKSLFGRADVIKAIRELPKGTGQREEAAVREYCKSLRQICNFRYVAEAVIFEPEQEKIRYYLVFATNHHRGIEVFKAAETAAARLQDEVRYDKRLSKTGQIELMLDQGAPSSPKRLEMRSRYCSLARRKVIELLSSKPGGHIIPYESVYCEAMAFPLVTPNDLENWVRELDRYVTLQLEGATKKRKPRPDTDSIVINKPRELKPVLRE